MITNFTARYVKTESGYMGQIIEWPEVITEGKDLEDCRAMLKDALMEMSLAFKQLGKEIPSSQSIFEQISLEASNVD